MARRAVLPHRTAAVLPLSEDLGRSLRYRLHGRRQADKGLLTLGPVRGLPRHSSRGGRCLAARTRQLGKTSGRPGPLLLPRALCASQP